MKISIGFELQTADMTFEMDRPSSMISTTRILYNQVDRVDLQFKDTNIQVYADSLSQIEDFENAKKLMTYFLQKYAKLKINDHLHVHTPDMADYFFNDAEFIVTYLKPHTVSSKYKSVLKFIVSKTLDAMNSVESYLKNQGELKKINKVYGQSLQQGKRDVDETSTFPYSKYYLFSGDKVEYLTGGVGMIYPQNLILLMKRNVKHISYYVQTTMGVELRCVWDVMIMLGKEYMKNPKAIESEVRYIKRMIKDEEELSKNHPDSKEEKNKVVKIVYLLFMYSCWTNSGKNRKRFPFIIRHYFVDVLKLLTLSQSLLLMSWIPEYAMIPDTNTTVKDRAYELYHDRSSIQTRYLSNTTSIRQRQKVEDVSVYYVSADKTNVLDTPILFEFRYMNSILNHLVSSKRGTHDHITHTDIEKILRGL